MLVVDRHKTSGYRCYACKTPLREGWACDKCGSDEAEEFHADENPTMAPLTSKEKQEAYRARQAMLGLKEVRGIFLPEELHAELKEHAQKLMASYRPKENK